ncbi:MAG: FAD-dependent oxidoreductase, partial [Myxococcota bacterium]
AILDDEAALLERWRRCTRNTGMRYLRSPGVHHLDLASMSLQQFARSGPGRGDDPPFTRPYSRPALDLFDRHCDAVMARYEMETLHVRGRANSLEIQAECVRVGFDARGIDRAPNALEAKRVILALGAPHEPFWPAWAQSVAAVSSKAGRARAVRHIFDPGFELDAPARGETVAVVGAGISGAQVAIRLAREGARVLLLSRHALRIHQFDSDSGWQGPKYMAGFARLKDYDERRSRIRKARHRGSIPRDVHSALCRAQKDGTIQHFAGVEVGAAGLSGERVSLDLGDRTLEVDRVLLATGYPSRRPGAGWLDEAIEAHDLPCADCGYPIVDRGLRWHPRVLVTGALAELELGPVSRNLSGARRAGDRIVSVARPDWHY